MSSHMSDNSLKKLFNEDVQTILTQATTEYEKLSGKELLPAQIEQLIINTWAYRGLLFNTQANLAYFQGFPQYATGAALDAHGEQVGAIRLSEKPATVTLKFSVYREKETRRIIIQKGATLAVAQTFFITDEELVIVADKSSVTVAATCLESGMVGNDFAPGKINQIEQIQLNYQDALDDISVTNTTISSAGADAEDDVRFLERILAAPEAFTTGTRGAYAFWAKSVSTDIVDVVVDNPKDAEGKRIGGKVDITILTKNGLPSDDLIYQTQQFCADEKRRDLCDEVSVKKPVSTNVFINAKLTLLASADKVSVLAQANASLQQYITKQQAKLGKDIVQLDIAKALKVNGVYDVDVISPTLTVLSKTAWAQFTTQKITLADEVVDD